MRQLIILVISVCVLTQISTTGDANGPSMPSGGAPAAGSPGRGGGLGNPGFGVPGFGVPGFGVPGNGGPNYGAPAPGDGSSPGDNGSGSGPGYYSPEPSNSAPAAAPPSPGPSYSAPVAAPPSNNPPSSGTGTPAVANPFGDPTADWSDPSQVLVLLSPPSGGPGPPLLDQPLPGTPLARNPQLLQATLDAYNAMLAAKWSSDTYSLANATDWVGWTAQTGLTYVPGIGNVVNVPLTIARGAGEGFGSGLADPNASLADAIARGVIRAGVATTANAMFYRSVPGGGGVTDFTYTVVQETEGTGAKVFVALTGIAGNTLSNIVSGLAGDAIDPSSRLYLISGGQKGAH